MSFEPFIYAIIFVGVLLMVEGIYLVVFGKSVRLEGKVNRRLELLEKGEDPEDVLNTLRKEREQHRESISLPILAPLSAKAAQANIAFTPAALVIVFIWLSNKAKKRISLFEEQLPDAVELIVRSLRVGHPFSSAINIVAQEMPDPLGSEFGMIADESTYGMDVNESLAKMAERVNVQDLMFLTVAVNIQSTSGGNLAEILDGLGKVIRSRFKLFRRVRAITAEARWSGWFLSVFPLLAIVMINVSQPEYYAAVKESSFFVPAAVVVGVLLLINVIFMRIMVNIKV